MNGAPQERPARDARAGEEAGRAAALMAVTFAVVALAMTVLPYLGLVMGPLLAIPAVVLGSVAVARGTPRPLPAVLGAVLGTAVIVLNVAGLASVLGIGEPATSRTVMVQPAGLGQVTAQAPSAAGVTASDGHAVLTLDGERLRFDVTGCLHAASMGTVPDQPSVIATGDAVTVRVGVEAAAGGHHVLRVARAGEPPVAFVGALVRGSEGRSQGSARGTAYRLVGAMTSTPAGTPVQVDLTVECP